MRTSHAVGSVEGTCSRRRCFAHAPHRSNAQSPRTVVASPVTIKAEIASTMKWSVAASASVSPACAGGQGRRRSRCTVPGCNVYAAHACARTVQHSGGCLRPCRKWGTTVASACARTVQHSSGAQRSRCRQQLSSSLTCMQARRQPQLPCCHADGARQRARQAGSPVGHGGVAAPNEEGAEGRTGWWDAWRLCNAAAVGVCGATTRTHAPLPRMLVPTGRAASTSAGVTLPAHLLGNAIVAS